MREAADGRAGLDRLAEETPGLILLDLMMPEMDGFEFVHELRRTQAWQSIPVVVVTTVRISRQLMMCNGSRDKCESSVPKGRVTIRAYAGRSPRLNSRRSLGLGGVEGVGCNVTSVPRISAEIAEDLRTEKTFSPNDDRV